MAAWLNKWLLFSIFPIFTAFTDNPARTHAETFPHPLHLSVVEINHNSADQALEISCKIFTDDFERVLRKNFPGRKIDLINPPNRGEMVSTVNEYMKKNLQIRVDGRPVQYTCIGFEQEDDATYSYFQVDKVAMVKRIDLRNTILHDLYTDQANINHIIVGGKRKSSKLDQPASEAVFEFN